MKYTLTLWKDEWALHCPGCNNVFNIEWWDGDDKLGLGTYRCPECLLVFVPTAKMFNTHKSEHGTCKGKPYIEKESAAARARREARE